MPLTSKNMEIINALYRSIQEKDYNAFRSMCSAELEWIHREGLPPKATYIGTSVVVGGLLNALSIEKVRRSPKHCSLK